MKYILEQPKNVLSIWQKQHLDESLFNLTHLGEDLVKLTNFFYFPIVFSCYTNTKIFDWLKTTLLAVKCG